MTRPGAQHVGRDAVTDTVLVEQALQGNHRSFEELVRRYERLVFRIAGGLLRDRGEAEDVAQEAFLRAFQALPRFHAGASFGPWISRIATRLCYDRFRARRAARESSWDDLSSAEQQAARACIGEGPVGGAAVNRDLAARLLERLSPTDRQVLLLADGMGYTAAEAAGMLGCSPLAVRLRLHRARRAMQRAAARLLDGMTGEA
jgi:RNA polymerase sigma-70 factor, ECF subfamily